MPLAAPLNPRSPADLAEALDRLGWSAADLQRITESDRTAVWRWLKSGQRVPGPVLALIRLALLVGDQETLDYFKQFPTPRAADPGRRNTPKGPTT